MRASPYHLRIALAIVVVILLTLPLEAKEVSASNQSNADLDGVKIALWNGRGALESSVIALEHMFTWMNASVIYTNSSHIRDGGLEGIDILVFPGGSTGSYTTSLGSEGMQIVRSFVSNGGSYFGICGGSLFATRLRLELFNGSYVGPVAGATYYMMNMSVNRESTGPDLSEEPETYSLLYWNSAYFSADDMSGIIPIVTYPSNGEPAMIAFHYDYGTVFLSSPHPEYEEDSDRDGTADFDNFVDLDSEWGLLLKVTRWLVDTSTECCPIVTTTDTISGPTTNTTDVETPLNLYSAFIIGSIGILIVMVVIILKRR